MADIPKAEASDMSIDELSAAIDEHMMGVSSTPKKTKKTAASKIIKPKPEKKIEEKVVEKSAVADKPKEEETKAGNTKSSRIEVRRSGYMTSDDDETKEKSTESEEPDGRIASGKRSIKPIESETEEAKKPTKTSMVDVVVKQSPSAKSVDAKKETEVTPKEAEKEPEEKEVDKKEPAAIKEAPEKPEEAEPAPAKTEKKEEAKPEPLPKRSNDVEELSAQIGDTKKDEDKPAKSDTLKTYDTKQYHIPIKPSHHHRAGSSFMVFAAVLAGILAVVFVLNELEIIDLTSLIYTN